MRSFRRFLSPLYRALGPLALALALGAAPLAAHASLVRAMELGELTAQAERIIVGEVLTVKSAWDEDHKRIFTTVEVSVAETWKGVESPKKTVLITQPGGVVGDIEMRVHGLPRFTPGERSVLFLRGDRTSQVLGLSQGRRLIEFDAGLKKWMVGAADRSSAVVFDAKGKVQPAPAEPRLPLDELRRQVRALVKP